MTRIVPVRLTEDEIAALDKIVFNNETIGFENRSEFFRLMLQRERIRRGEKLKDNSFRTANRVFSGLPSE